MNRSTCIQSLRVHARPILSFAEDFTVVLRVRNQGIVVSTSKGTIESFDVESDVDERIACFEFDSWSTVNDLLIGRIDLADVFLSGNIRSNGYLTLIFPIMSIFQRHRGLDIPE